MKPLDEATNERVPGGQRGFLTMKDETGLSEIASQVWNTKYRFVDDAGRGEQSLADSWRRLAKALASVETQDAGLWEERFYGLLEGFKFLPGGRILAGAGTGRSVTLFNCFVMGAIDDSMEGIFDALKEGAITMQQGGGVGYDFSTLRPRGMPARRVGGIASGPVSFMHIWDSMCGTIMSTGFRRGAMMATLRCDHPDIELFIDAKRDSTTLRRFNLSVLVGDDFMKAVEEGAEWPLVFPDESASGEGRVLRRWSGCPTAVPCRVFKKVGARALWDRIMRAAYDYAEPGVLFVDRINGMNNLAYCEKISATNPCGEIPLPPYGACNLGSVNLTRFILHPFTGKARVDMEAIAATVWLAVRFLDNVIDLSQFPLPRQKRQALATRRIGLGITGLADALIMLGVRYGDENAREIAARVMEAICHTAYRASIDLGREKGAFPLFKRKKYLGSAFVASLPEEIRDGISRSGLRNSHLIAIAPAGTISLLADNVSSGVEPVFDLVFSRKLLTADGGEARFQLEDYALRLWRRLHGEAPLPAAFVDAGALSPRDHLKMQAALQRYVDNAISKTVNVPADFPFDGFKSLYEEAFRLGLKGCAAFHPNPVTGEVLSRCGPERNEKYCCSPEREAD